MLFRVTIWSHNHLIYQAGQRPPGSQWGKQTQGSALQGPGSPAVQRCHSTAGSTPGTGPWLARGDTLPSRSATGHEIPLALWLSAFGDTKFSVFEAPWPGFAHFRQWGALGMRSGWVGRRQSPQGWSGGVDGPQAGAPRGARSCEHPSSCLLNRAENAVRGCGGAGVRGCEARSQPE